MISTKISIVFFAIMISIAFHPSFAVEFTDSTGYMPSWAKNMGVYPALNECGKLSSQDVDFDWCMEWMAYVLDQGIENFPESASGNTKPQEFSEPDEVYTGKLEKFLPVNSFGSDWQVSKPFTYDVLKEFDDFDVTDTVFQRIVVNDQKTSYDKIPDSSKSILLQYGIMQFSSENEANGFYKFWANNLKQEQIPNQSVDAFYGVKQEYLFKPDMYPDESSTLDDILRLTDCYGYHKNFERTNEEFHQICIEKQYVIMTTAKMPDGCCIDDPKWMQLDSESFARDLTDIISSRIDGSIPDSTNMHQEREFFDIPYEESDVNSEYEIKPQRKQAIDEAIQNLEPFPFYETRTQEEWHYYITKVNKILKETKSVQPESNVNTIPDKNDTLDNDTRDLPEWAAASLGAFILLGIPAIVIWLIIRKVKKRNKYQSPFQ